MAGRLTLNPISHIDPIGSVLVPGLLALSGTNMLFGWAKPVPYNPYNIRYGKWGEALVAVAGPVTNIVLAGIFAIALQFDAIVNPSFIMIAQTVILLNIVLAVFNMVPIPPLDGSKVLFALLPDRFYHIRESLERFGFFFVVVFVFFGFGLIRPLIESLYLLFI
jgi:Zn-dependent protease